jgi:hypothetical protein
MNNENTRSGGNAAPPRVLSRSELQKQVTDLAAQRGAISEVLRAIASSPHDLQPIFRTILESAARMCRAEVGVFRLVEEAGLRLVAHKVSPAMSKEYPPPVLLEHSSFVARFIARNAHGDQDISHRAWNGERTSCRDSGTDACARCVHRPGRRGVDVGRPGWRERDYYRDDYTYTEAAAAGQ